MAAKAGRTTSGRGLLFLVLLYTLPAAARPKATTYQSVP